MRDEYIKLIHEYIQNHPNYEQALEEIKTQVLLIGATEEEFNEAIKRLTGIPNATEVLQPEQSKKFGLTDKPVVKQILRNKKLSASLACILVALFGIMFFKHTPNNNSQVATQTAKAQTNQASSGPIPQVYASTSQVSSQQVFSYPPQNVSLLVSSKPKKQVVGFLPSWMYANANQIDLSEITTVNLFGIAFDGKGNIVTAASDGAPDSGWLMWNDPTLPAYITKVQNQNINVDLTVKCFNNNDIESLTSSDDSQSRFISNVLYMVGSKHLNGVNVDFEYVGTPPDATRDGFTRLITNLQAALKHEYPNAMLTIDTYITSGQTPDLFDLPALVDKADDLIIMAYDVHTPNGDPGPVSPMQGDINIIGMMQNYFEKVPADKLIMAVPYYGYDWVVNQNNNQATGSAQMVAYAQAVNDSKNYKVQWDPVSETPWYSYIDPATNLQHEVYFDDVRSLGIKYDFINEKNLAGVGIWALGYDGLNTDLNQLLADKFGK